MGTTVSVHLALLTLAGAIASGRTAWPRWFALVANPISLVAIGAAIVRVSPEPVRTWLEGAAFNTGRLVLYALPTWLLWNDRQVIDGAANPSSNNRRQAGNGARSLSGAPLR